jgi:hypothetical protein
MCWITRYSRTLCSILGVKQLVILLIYLLSLNVFMWLNCYKLMVLRFSCSHGNYNFILYFIWISFNYYRINLLQSNDLTKSYCTLDILIIKWFVCVKDLIVCCFSYSICFNYPIFMKFKLICK